MKHLVIAAAVLLLATLAAKAQEQPKEPRENDCTLGTVGPIVKDAPGEKVERLRKGPRELRERTELGRGLQVEITQGGCAHYGLRMLFKTTWRSSLQSERPSRLLTEALGLLRELKQRTESTAVSDTITVLAAHERDAYKNGEPLQDERFPDVTVYVTGGDRANTRTVEVTYSFVL